MRRKIFLHYFFQYLTPIILPVLFFGIIAISVLRGEIRNNINLENHNILTQYCSNMDQLLNESTQLLLSIDNNPFILYRLNSLLSSARMSQSSYADLQYIMAILSKPQNDRSYVYSSYVYIHNNNRFLSSKEGLLPIADSYDISWYSSYLASDPEIHTWTEIREIVPVKNAEKQTVLSIFRRTSNIKGVIVFNILPEYLDLYLNSLQLSKERGLVVLDESENIIISKNTPALSGEVLSSVIPADASTPSHINIAGQVYWVNVINSQTFQWKYLMLTNQNLLYQVPNFLTFILILLLGIALLIGTLLALLTTKKLSDQVYEIIDLLQSPQTDYAKPNSSKKNISDPFSTILENILSMYVKENNLKMQLAEINYQRLDAEFAALQAQINPHFIFNTLEIISYECMGLTHSHNQASQMLQQLALMLRYSLSAPNELVYLSQELENAEHYLKLQTYRWEEQMIYRLNIEESLYHIRCPKLILQPIIENAIIHAFDKTSSQVFSIDIFGIQEEETAYVTIRDNGRGITSDQLAELKKQLRDDNVMQSTQIGLYNIHHRLRLHYGSLYGITIDSVEGQYTAVTLSFPAG